MTQNVLETVMSALVILMIIPVVVWRKSLLFLSLASCVTGISMLVHAIGGDWIGLACTSAVMAGLGIRTIMTIVMSDDWF